MEHLTTMRKLWGKVTGLVYEASTYDQGRSSRVSVAEPEYEVVFDC
jgi:hypothetical protein